ncbi:MAG: hypothetical protein WCF77_03030 [Minisyncoccia bacterium]
MNKNKGSILVGVLIVMIVLLAVGFIWYFLENSHNTISAPTLPPQVVSSGVALSQNNPYSGWRTYSDDALGFQFQYPSYFETNVSSNLGTGFDFSSVATSTGSPETLNVVAQQATGSIAIDVTNYQRGNNAGSPNDCLATPQITYLTVAGESAVRIDCENSESPFGGSPIGPTASLDFYHDGFKFLMGVNGFATGNDVLGEIAKTISFSK